METREHTAPTQRIPASPIAAGRRFGLAAMLIGMLMLVCGAAQAEPGAASVYLQRTKSDFAVLQINVLQGRNAALAGRTEQARSFFIAAKVQSITMNGDTVNLYYQNVDTLSRGLYRNQAYQQNAVYYSNLLKTYTQLLDAYLSVLVQTPSSSPAYFSAYANMLNVTTELQRTQQAMTQAQL